MSGKGVLTTFEYPEKDDFTTFNNGEKGVSGTFN